MISHAVCLAPKRLRPYDLKPDRLNIDKELVAVCDKCKKRLNKFQRKNIQDVDYSNEHFLHPFKLR